MTHLLGWFPGKLLSGDPAEDGWELHTAEDWHHAADARLRLGGTVNDDPAQLRCRVAAVLADHFDVVGFRRSIYVIRGVGDPASRHYLAGPFTFAMFEVRTRPASPVGVG